MKSRFKLVVWALAAIIIACIAYLVHDRSGRHEKRDAEIPADPAMPEKNGRSTSSGAARPPAAAGERYADMDILKANAILTEIGKRELAAIFQAMLDAERVEHEPMKQMHLQSTFSLALHERTPSPEFLAQLRAFITNKANSKFEKNLVIGALGEAATVETVEILIELATTSFDPPVRTSAIGSLATIGNRTAQREKVAPMLEKLWPVSTDEGIVIGVALSMARMGKASSVEMLLNAAQTKDFPNELHRNVAIGALEKVYVGDAVPPLQTVLEGNPVGSDANELAWKTLARIVDDNASAVMMKWLQAADEKAAPMAREWIANAHLGPELKAAEAALDPSVPFRSEENRKALRAGLATYRAEHRIGE